MAELSMDEKNRLSHQARAVIKAKPVLEVLFQNLVDTRQKPPLHLGVV